MKTQWEYTDLADAYLKRPDYSDEAIQAMLNHSGLDDSAHVCDVGAGVAHLTIKLAEQGFQVDAVEPNDAMRSNGIRRTERFANINWFEGTGEETGRPDNGYHLVTFGSSFNVCDRSKALLETRRILKPRGWFACMWNHRDLKDPIQKSIEGIIASQIDGYDYGSRREDQTEVIDQSGLFGEVFKIEGAVSHRQTIADCVEAWRSHATLQRQAGDHFGRIVDEIEKMLLGLDEPNIIIPYTTRLWMAQLRA